MSKNTKSGYIMVEASICLPIFIIAVIAVSWLMKAAAIEEDIAFLALNEGRETAMQAYNIDTNPLFPLLLEKKIEERAEDAGDIRVTSYRYLYRSEKRDNLISYRVSFALTPALPLISAELTPEIELTMRAFRGKDNAGAASFDALEKAEESCEVWVFPAYGERYHSRECSTISLLPEKRLLTSLIKMNHKSCKTCGSSAMKNGNPAYVFGSGSAYHFGHCPTVKKYVVSMEKKDAESRGYTPCMKCGGGN